MTKTFTIAFIALCCASFFAQAQDIEQAQFPKETLPVVNTKYLEARPLISGDGTKLFFVRRFFPGNIDGEKDFQDIYVSTYDSTSNTWSPAVNIGTTLNNKLRNAVASVNADGTEGIFFNTYKGTKKAPLVRSRKTANGWSKPIPVPINKFVNTSEFADFHLDFRNNVLFSAIEGDQTQGEQDIYISFPNGFGGWKEPVNLGPVINTKRSEFSPFLGSDGRSLFFSSYGHNGLGGSDIYMSVRLDDSWLRWSEPVNLGPSINSAQEETYFSITDDFKYLYYTSNVANAADRDIQRVRLPENFTAINGPVLVNLDSMSINNIMLSGNYTVSPMGAQRNFEGVSFEGWPTEEDQQEVEEPVAVADATPSPTTTTTTTTTDAGTTPARPASTTPATTARPAGESARYAGFVPVEQANNLSPEAEQLKRYLQQKLPGVDLLVRQQNNAVEFKIVQNLLYDFNSVFVSSEYLSRLRTLSNILRERENLELKLIGHTDQQGSDEANERVARQRVVNLEYYFRSRGIADKRIDAIGAGMREPLVANDTEENRRMNRRVETIIQMPL